jgi:ectoine hydroxylase-related dioxygenase (phytanoyl-CoA dioxygenase family)
MNPFNGLGAARPLTSGGIALEPDASGLLHDSSADLDDIEALRARMARDGYLFLRSLLDRASVLEARAEITRRLQIGGVLAPGTDSMDAFAGSRATQLDRATKAGLTRDNTPLHSLLYAGPMMAFFDRFFGEPTRHYDFTWFRAVPPGRGTPVHADVVFMGRAERDRLFTAWTPLGDIDTVQGGLMILEGSCGSPELARSYYELDVDVRCINRDDKRDEWDKGTNGWLTSDPAMIRRRLGGRWLTSPYRAGDVLLFSVFTVHASLDNHSDRFRLSADSRYQPASKPADGRWIGPNPTGHGPEGKRDLIC